MSDILIIIKGQAEYAISALTELALRAGPDALRSPEIAARLDISPASLEQVMVRLRRHGLVRSYRGATGGYALARPPEEITVGEVLAVFLPRRQDAAGVASEVTVRQVVHEGVRRIEAGLARIMGDVSIAALADECRQRDEAMAYMPGL